MVAESGGTSRRKPQGSRPLRDPRWPAGNGRRLRQAPRWPRQLLRGLWLAVGVLLLASLAGLALPWWGVLLAVVTLGSSIAVGVICQGCGFFARPLNGVQGEPRLLALTFDDGPDPAVTPQVLALLAAAKQRATFFVIGQRAQRYPELVRQIAARGHELANHSWNHPWQLSLWPARRVARQLARTSELLREQSGAAPRWFRPPAAVLSPAIARGARLADLQLVGYTHRSGDGSALVPRRVVRRRLLAGLRGGAVLVLHDALVAGAAPVSLALLPELLAELQRRGLSSVPLGELLAQQDQDSGKAGVCPACLERSA